MQKDMKTSPSTKPTTKNFNKPAYAVFVALGCYFLFIQDFSQAVIFWGLALVFDPFTIDQPFKLRPFYQKAWLIAHLLITIGLFSVMLLHA